MRKERTMNASSTEHAMRAERPPRRLAAVAAAIGLIALAAEDVPPRSKRPPPRMEKYSNRVS
jgi:hypothetical protein